MKKVMIKLESIEAVKEFVSEVTLCDYDVDLVSGRYAVDAKSIMGIFSLDLSNPIQLIARTEDVGDFFEKIKDFIVE
ncbi:MAG: HPr family phosphocarrier protein [Ruminococcus sp.]|nr:HPr family phosphocarrier protein [Ruminococcus sp.]